MFRLATLREGDGGQYLFLTICLLGVSLLFSLGLGILLWDVHLAKFVKYNLPRVLKPNIDHQESDSPVIYLNYFAFKYILIKSVLRQKEMFSKNNQMRDTKTSGSYVFVLNSSVKKENNNIIGNTLNSLDIPDRIVG